MQNEIILFENQNAKLKVNMKDETVWLSLDQMSKLFDRDKSVISRHVKNALSEELNDNTLASLTLLIAESNPKEKEILVDLITNFLN